MALDVFQHYTQNKATCYVLSQVRKCINMCIDSLLKLRHSDASLLLPKQHSQYRKLVSYSDAVSSQSVGRWTPTTMLLLSSREWRLLKPAAAAQLDEDPCIAQQQLSSGQLAE
jgi:hypothetical protein